MTPHARRPEPGSTGAVSSHAQDGAWYLSAVDAAATTHSLAFRVRGPLDTAALATAWDAVTARHEALRTTLTERDGRPVPHVHPRGTSLSTVDLQAAPARFAAVHAELAGTPLAPDGEPPVRAALVRLGTEEHALILTWHAAFVDVESVPVLLADLAEHYATPGTARPPAPRYTAFARWQRAHVASPAFDDLLGRWTAALTPPPPPLELPADRVRPPAPSARGGALAFEWPGLGAEVTAAARARDTTPDVVVLAAFQVLLHRLGDAGSVCVGTPVSVRRDVDEGAVGVFTNLLPLGADLADDPAFGTHLDRLTATTHAAHAAADVPFDRIVHAVGVDRDARRIPLCDAVFDHRPAPRLRLTGTEVTPLPAPFETVTTDLALTLRPVGTTVAGTLAYRAALLDRTSAEQVLAQLRTLLTAALADPDLPVGELPLEPLPRILAATRSADATGAASADTRTVCERIRAIAAARPDAAAVVWQGATVSYGELVRRAAAVTAALGAVDGSAVAVRLPQGPERVAALIGVLDAGAQLVCLGTGDTGERGRQVLADLRPLTLVEQGPGDDLTTWFRTRQHGRVLDVSLLPEHSGAVAPPLADAAACAYVAYTSGSTGLPKGIPTTHASLAQLVSWLAEEFRIGPGTRFAQWAAAGYDANLVEVFATLTAGATLCPVPDEIRPNPDKLVGWLADERVTLFQTVPSFAREVLRAVVAAGAAGTLALDHLLLAGEVLSGDLADSLRAVLPSVRLINMYGPTETILATWHPVGDAVSGPVPIGRSIPGRQVLVLDEGDRPCPAGVTGQLVIVSPHVTAGYTGPSAVERDAFIPLVAGAVRGIAPGRCYRTGDRGRRRWDGTLEFLGRGDVQVKFFGVRVELTDLEAALAEHDSVAECAVTAVANEEGLVNRLVAHVVPARDDHGRPLGGPADWRAVLRTRFGRARFPVLFRTVLGLPRNLGGKVDRRRLPTHDAARAEPARAAVDPALTEVWAEVLGTAPVSAEDSFFTSGGHSLLVPVLLNRVREHLGVEVPMRDFLADPTIAGLSARSGPPRAAVAVPETRNG